MVSVIFQLFYVNNPICIEHLIKQPHKQSKCKLKLFILHKELNDY